MLVERLAKAEQRGARIYGEVLGFGITSDGTGVGRIDPEGEGIERAMRVALERAGVDAANVKAVWSGASGLKVADEAEAKAIERVLDGGAKVISPKLTLGEPMGAGASLSTALALKGWQEGDEDASPKGPVLVNSASLGGTNFSLVLAPYEG